MRNLRLEELETRLLLSGTSTFGDTAVVRQDAWLTKLRLANIVDAPRCVSYADPRTGGSSVYENASGLLFEFDSSVNVAKTSDACTLDGTTRAELTFGQSFKRVADGGSGIWRRSFDGSRKWSQAATDPLPPAVPSTIALEPSSISVQAGKASLITGRFADPNGIDDIRFVEMRAADQYSTIPRCFVRYELDTGLLKLYDNEAATLLTVGKLGAGSSASISECTVDAANSSVSIVDPYTLDLSVSVSFTKAIVGTTKVWLRAYDFSDQWSSIDDRGTLTITPPPPNRPPVTEAIAPESLGAGISRYVTLLATFSDPDGANDLGWVELVVGDDQDSTEACWVSFDFETNEFRLYDVATSSHVVAGTTGEADVVVGAACTVNAVASSATRIDETSVEVAFHLSFDETLEGTRNIWLRATDKSGAASTTDVRGSIEIVPATLNQTPINVRVVPNDGSTEANVPFMLTGRYMDTNGVEQIRLAELRISTGFTTVPRCFLRYDQLKDELSLFDYQTELFVLAGSPGSPGSASNASCTLDASTSSVSAVDANTLDVQFGVVFTELLEGARNLWARSFEADGEWTNPVDLGDIRIGPPAFAPTTISVTPDDAIADVGTPIAITGRFADQNGGETIQIVDLRISHGASVLPRCYVRYDVQTDELKLYDDFNGTFAPAGPIGSDSVTQNSNCTLFAKSSAISVVDAATIEFSASVSFKPTMMGEKKVWLHAEDRTGANSPVREHANIAIINTGTPSPPQGLMGTPGNAIVSLHWLSNTETDLAGYNVYRSPGPQGPFVPVNEALLTAPLFTDAVVANEPHYYSVTAVDADGQESIPSAAIALTPRAGPWTPTTLRATPDMLLASLDTQVTVAAQFADGDGAEDLRHLEMRIAEQWSSQPRCYVRYDTLSEQFLLWDDAADEFVTNGSPGASSIVANTNCSLDVEVSTEQIVDPLTRRLTVGLQFAEPFQGNYSVWLRSIDHDGTASTADDRGDILVGEQVVPIHDGYTDAQSYEQNTRQTVYINATQTIANARIDLYDVTGSIVDSVHFDAKQQTSSTPDPAVEGFGYSPSFSYDLGSLPSGVYLWGNRIPFVVKDSAKSSRIRVVLPTNTMNAYECTGGRNLYSGCGGELADILSFDRQMKTVNHFIPASGENIRRESGGWSLPFFWWLEQEIHNLGASYGALADIDLDDPSALHGADIVVLPGHSEYWTRKARENVDDFVDRGGNLVVLSGNTMWWQVRYEDDRLIAYKSLGDDPIQDPLLKTYRWDHPSLAYPITNSIGLEFGLGGYLDINPPGNAPASFNGYKVVAQNSPLLAGTGVAEGDIISWDTDQVFTEYDGPPVAGLDGRGYPIIDNQALGFDHVELVAFDHSYHPASFEGFGTLIAFRKTPTSGIVVNAGTMLWAYEMTKSPDADKIQTITYNALDKLLKNESVFSPPATLEAQSQPTAWFTPIEKQIGVGTDEVTSSQPGQLAASPPAAHVDMLFRSP